MVKIEAVVRDEDKNVQSGIKLWWHRTDGTLLYQTWEHKASGPIWYEVEAERVKVTDFMEYFIDKWGVGGFTITEVDEF